MIPHMNIFHRIGTMGRFGLVVAMSVCIEPRSCPLTMRVGWGGGENVKKPLDNGSGGKDSSRGRGREAAVAKTKRG